jgi:Family of unknown function (DUF5990)
VRIEINGHTLPGRACCGRSDVRVGVQRRREVVDLFPGDAPAARWAFDVDEVLRPDGAADVRGAHVPGRPGERFVYLSWGGVGGDGGFAMFRRAKLLLDDPALLAAAAGGTLVGELGLTRPDGTPVCAAVRPPGITWAVRTAQTST